jgi:hypothetical protein
MRRKIMNCAICNKPFEDDDVVQILDGKPVHRPCLLKKRQEEETMKKELEKAVDAEYEEVTEAKDEESAPTPKCEITIGVQESGDLYFVARGSDPSLLNIEGLLKFAQLKMGQIWEQRVPKPTQEAPDAEV